MWSVVIIILLIKHYHIGFDLSHRLYVFVSTARKESAKEKQLKEEEKILESVAEGRGNIVKLKWCIINLIYFDKLTDIKTVYA